MWQYITNMYYNNRKVQCWGTIIQADLRCFSPNIPPKCSQFKGITNKLCESFEKYFQTIKQLYLGIQVWDFYSSLLLHGPTDLFCCPQVKRILIGKIIIAFYWDMVDFKERFPCISDDNTYWVRYIKNNPIGGTQQSS